MAAKAKEAKPAEPVEVPDNCPTRTDAKGNVLYRVGGEWVKK